MLEWFEKKAPIRQKFNVLTGATALSTGLATGAIIYAAAQGYGPLVLGGISVASMALTALFVLGAKRAICSPIATTVLRMEGIASGDLNSPIEYLDHEDCVGRMANAMQAFQKKDRLTDSSGSVLQNVIGTLSKGLDELAAGNLTHRIDVSLPPEYVALRSSFNKAFEELADTLARVSSLSSAVHNGSSEILAASNDLAMRTEQQAAALGQTTSAMTQVTAMVQETASSAKNVQSSIGETQREADQGGQVVQRAVTAMGAIEKSSQEISQIINVIDGIAFQTNLLALNAGVEAARAGDAGKGFAVVANEVRALAQRSADAAKDIKELITASTVQVGDGVQLVAETGQRLQKIVDRVAEIGGLITSITQAAEVQASSLQQVSSSISDMDKMTQQNAAMVEESTAASRSLANEADQLATLVTRFQTGSKVRMRAAPAPAPARLRAAPAVQGNLAMKAPHDDDWAEF